VASTTANAAARRLAQGRTAARTVRLRRDKDVKIAADETLDRLIRRSLSRQSPFSVLSEESGFRADQRFLADGEYHWIVDPLDGSLNLSRGIPFSCVSIALWREMRPVLGVIRDCHRKERFSGIVGQGAWLNDQAIHVSDVRSPREAILCTGFPAGADYSAAAIEHVISDIQAYQKIRWLGSAALSLAYVACGRADVYAEEGIALWDVAAGVAIVQAAGGFAQVEPAGTGATVSVQAGNPWLMELAAGTSMAVVSR